MRRTLIPLLVLAAGLVFAGCPRATFLGYEIPDPNKPELIIESSVKGLSHVQDVCLVVAATSDWYGESQAFMDEEAPEPQVIRTLLRRWRANHGDKPYLKNIPPGALRFFFIYRNGHDFFRSDKPSVEQPDWDPIELAKNPRPTRNDGGRNDGGRNDGGRNDGGRNDGGETRTDDVLDTRPDALSLNPSRPTKVNFRSDRAEFECGVSRNQGPQYALLQLGTGRIRVTMKVTSHQTSGSPTWWSVEVVDKDGESLADQQQELGFLDPGATVEKIAEWKVTGKERILKINSGSEAGDTLEISITKLGR